MIFSILLVLYAFTATSGLIHIVFGCGRSFKNARKCHVWSCLNKDKCHFYEWEVREHE